MSLATIRSEPEKMAWRVVGYESDVGVIGNASELTLELASVDRVVSCGFEHR
jgi:hypothetical protein